MDVIGVGGCPRWMSCLKYRSMSFWGCMGATPGEVHPRVLPPQIFIGFYLRPPSSRVMGRRGQQVPLSFARGGDAPCTEDDGCAGCTRDGHGNPVIGASDCAWEPDFEICYRWDIDAHCETGDLAGLTGLAGLGFAAIDVDHSTDNFAVHSSRPSPPYPAGFPTLAHPRDFSCD